jgi:hypothetical protein
VATWTLSTYADAQGWIELRNNGFWITLTAAGYAQVRED